MNAGDDAEAVVHVCGQKCHSCRRKHPEKVAVVGNTTKINYGISPCSTQAFGISRGAFDSTINIFLRNFGNRGGPSASNSGVCLSEHPERNPISSFARSSEGASAKKGMVGSTGRRNGIGKGSSRGAKAKSFSRSCIEFERDLVEIVLRVA